MYFYLATYKFDNFLFSVIKEIINEYRHILRINLSIYLFNSCLARYLSVSWCHSGGLRAEQPSGCSQWGA